MKKGSLICVMVVLMIGILVFGGCEGASSAMTGTALGGAAGAGIGALAGRDTKSTLIGAALGGVTGHVIGSEQDRKKARAQTDVAIAEANTFYVNITNSNGSISPIRLVKSGNVYIAPRGEQYMQLPTEEQLKAVGYGF